ncbi:glucosamine kinase [Cribrihabitans marinus]|uniref:Glucosamine kinase n=1 Tax=Cribrihabitans marinus TaxID=1227549 RepID=A0A1H7D0D5_9RHOB|nr:BadF/BadG/BcrA/BcrD ATPase family protein [Cribrihabitans marinus]GGH37291.1 N-acetylglucosamine kinase [Cribrihabitans marinus]SEJ95309.1 glucosamine kinase [Cribrihabitans marinus]
MMIGLDSAVIAVDGGGTRCRLALADASRVLRVEVGPANVTSDFHGAIRAIRDGLDQLAARSEVELAALSGLPAYLGLAGVTGADMARRVCEALPFERVTVEDDRPSALRGAVGAADGAIAHCGTGAFLAVQDGGRARLAGSWGSVLGDEASAFWVGRAALAHTLRALDGLAPQGAMTAELLDRLGSGAEIVAMATQAGPAEIAAFATTVTRHAASGDGAARDILRRGAACIAADLRAMGWRQGMPLCLTGGLGPAYADCLPDDMRAAVTPPLGQPIDGAIALAQAFAKERAA